MDCMAISCSPDSALEELGISKKGDLYALKAFCQKNNSSNAWETRKRALLEEVKQGSLQRVSKSKVQKRETRKILLGWKHYDEKKAKFITVVATKGGLMRDIEVPNNAGKNYLIDQGKKLFFENNKSYHGNVEDNEFSLINYKGEDIGSEFTVQKYIAQHKLSKLRIYLSTKTTSDHGTKEDKGKIWRQNLNHSKADGASTSQLKHDDTYQPISDSDDEFPDDTSVLIGTSRTRAALKDEQNDEYQKSLKADQEKDKQKAFALKSEIHKVERLQRLRKAREERILPEPDKDEECYKIVVQHNTKGRIMRSFPRGSTCSAIYDWAGSQDLEPENFELCVSNLSISESSSSAIKISPSDEIKKYDGYILFMKEVDGPIHLDDDDDEVTFQAFGPTSLNITNNTTLTDDGDIINPACEIPEQLMADDR